MPIGEWPMEVCGPGSKMAIDYLERVLSLSQAAPEAERSQIIELVAQCMLHRSERFHPGPISSPTHCGCVQNAEKAARGGDWQVVIQELDHAG